MPSELGRVEQLENLLDRVVTHALGCGAFDEDTRLWREAAAATNRDPNTGNRNGAALRAKTGEGR